MPMKKESLGFGEGRTGRFTIGFNSDGFRFRAQVEGQDGIFRTAAVSHSLVDLLEQCREQGMKHFMGMDDNAISEVYSWLTRDRPTLDYVAELWNEGSSPSEKGPLGFPKQST